MSTGTNRVAKFQAAFPEYFRQKVKGPMGCCSVPAFEEEGRKLCSWWKGLKTFENFLFLALGKGVAWILWKRSYWLLEFLPEGVESTWWLCYS